MRKIILALIITCGVSAVCASEPQYELRIVKNGVVGDVMGRLNVSDFRRMVRADYKDARMQAAEEGGHISVMVCDDPYVFDAEKGIYSCTFIIQWKDDAGVTFKELTVESKVKISKPKEPEKSLWSIIEMQYITVAKWGFPVTAALVILKILVVILL